MSDMLNTVSKPAQLHYIIAFERLTLCLTHIRLVPFLLDTGKEKSPRCDAAKRGVYSGSILFPYIFLIESLNKNEKLLPMPLKMKVENIFYTLQHSNILSEDSVSKYFTH